MFADETGAFGHEQIGEDRVLVDVGHEDAVAILARKLIGEVDAGAAVRGAMAVVGDGFDVVVDVGVDVFAALPVIDAAGDHVPEVRDHAGGLEGVAESSLTCLPELARSGFKTVEG